MLISGSNCCDTCGFFLFDRADNGSWKPKRRLKIEYPDGHKPFLRNITFVGAGDWDGDGIPDLITVGGLQKGLLVARGPLGQEERVKFTEPLHLPNRTDTTAEGHLLAFSVADWDRDGKAGLLVQHMRENRSIGIYWYKNLGETGLQNLSPGKLVYEVPKGIELQGFCVGDWNGDGWLDLITTQGESTGRNPDGPATGWRSSVSVHLRQ